MHARLSIFAVIFFVSVFVSAQDDNWRAGGNDIEYNCDTLSNVLSALEKSDEQGVDDLKEAIIAREESGTQISVDAFVASAVMNAWLDDPESAVTLQKLFSAATTACDQDAETANSSTSTKVDEFNVIVNGNVNIRACAGTQCDIVQVAENGSLLKVIGIEGDWYEVELDDGSTAFISSSLTVRGPDAIISVEEPYLDSLTGCIIAFDMKRGDMGINLILSGDARGDVIADLFRPNENRSLQVEGQLDKTFIDTGEPYIHQYYRFNVSWPNGIYQLEISLDGKTSKLAWELKTRGDYNIFIHCA